MFKIFRRVTSLETMEYVHHGDIARLNTRLQALEDYLDIEFFHGDKCKPHYRKKKVIIKKLGRPRKIK